MRVTDKFVSSDKEFIKFDRYVEQQMSFTAKKAERRGQKRVAITVAVTVQGVKEEGKQYVPITDTFSLVTRDLSYSGISLFSSIFIHHKLLLIDIDAPDIPSVTVIARVIRCRPVGGLYEIGCLFIKRFIKRIDA